MPDGTHLASEIRLGDFRVRRQSRELIGRGTTSVISPKALEVLECLLASGTRCVGRNEIIQQVWNDNFIVGEHGLRDAIWELRKAFGDNSRRPEFIQTLPRRGYRLMLLPQQQQPKNDRRRLSWPLAALAILALFSIAYWQFGRPQTLALQPWAGPAPAVASDQSRAAAIREVRGQPDLYLIDLPDADFGRKLVQSNDAVWANALQVTNSTRREWSPVWSPDSRSVAFMETDERHRCRVRVYQEKLHKIVTLTDDCHVVTSPVGVAPAQLAWSVDGTRLAYQSELDGGDVAIVSVEVARPSQKTRLSAVENGISAFPRWNRSGDLAYLHLDDNMMAKGRIMAQSVAGQIVMQCPSRPVWDVAWINQRYLAATVAHGNPFGIWVYDTYSGSYAYGKAGGRHLQPNPVAEALLVDHYQMASPLQLAHLNDQAPTVNLDSSHAPVAVDYASATGMLAVASARDGMTELVVGKVGESGQTVYTAMEIYRPRFSPTGRHLAFSARNSQKQNVRALVLDLESGRIQYLSSGNQAVFFSEWGEKEDHFYALLGVPSPLGTGAVAVAATPAGQVIEVLGQDLGLNLVRDETGGLWWSDEDGIIFRRASEGTTPQPVYQLNSAYESWVVTPGGALYFTQTTGKSAEIKVLNSAVDQTPRVARVVASPLDPIIGLTPGPEETVIFRRSSTVWRARQSIPVTRLTATLSGRDSVGLCLPDQHLARVP